MAAGLNASYHDGGMRWAHEIVDQVAHNSNAVMDLAAGRAVQFLAEARVLDAGPETSSCPLATALAEVRNRVVTRVQSRMAESDAELNRVEVLTDRGQAQLIRLEANRSRIEAQLAKVRIPAMAFNPAVVSSPRISICPRLRMSIPRLPVVKVPTVPMVHIDMPGAGPV